MAKNPTSAERYIRLSSEITPAQSVALENIIFATACDILTTYPHELPDYIMPETSGRIIDFFMNSVLTAVAKTRGVEPPKGYPFLGISSVDKRYSDACRLESRLQVPAAEILRRSRRKEVDNLPKEKLANLRRAVKFREYETQQARTIQEARLKERRTNPLIILDTTVDRGTTAREINAAFETRSDSRIPLFCFFSWGNHTGIGDIPLHITGDFDIYSRLGKILDDQDYAIRGRRKYRDVEISKTITPVPLDQVNHPYLSALNEEMDRVNRSVLQRLQAQGF